MATEPWATIVEFREKVKKIEAEAPTIEELIECGYSNIEARTKRAEWIFVRRDQAYLWSMRYDWGKLGIHAH